MAFVTPDILPEVAIEHYGRAHGEPLLAPHPDTFARHPQFWHFACTAGALPPGVHQAVELAGRRLVVFRGAGGRPSAVDARCPHLGSDLAGGRVVGDAIECPYHRFRFNGEGRCRERELSVRAYPTEERLGAIFVCSSTQAPFPLPAFADDLDLVSARPLRWRLDTQWFMVGANAFDARHFGAAHGRRLLAPPAVSRPSRHALRVSYEYAIEGNAWADRLVRSISGTEVAFDVTSWCGNVLLVHARFRRDASYGLVVVEPRHAARWSTDVTVIVNAERGRGRAALVTDRLRLHAKRFAIARMMQDDLVSLRRLDYVHDGLRSGDEVLAQYLRWVRVAAGSDDATLERRAN